MADNSKIEWTEATWNPVTGCTKVSPGCDHCYAETFAERWRGTPGHPYERGFDLTLRPERLDQPLRWKRPRRIFVNSMSDLFHDKVSADYIAQVFGVMAASPVHTFQVLTKRHGRLKSLLNEPGFVEVAYEHARAYGYAKYDPSGGRENFWPLLNVWMGVSVENQKHAELRIPALLETPAAVRWISAEPLLGPIDLRNLNTRGALIDCLGGDVKSPSDGAAYTGTPSVLDWVVAGGESGPGARPAHPDWFRTIRDQCRAADVPFLFKQWGAYRWIASDRWDPETGNWVDGPAIPERVHKKLSGRHLDGRTWDQYPDTADLAKSFA